MPTFSWVNFQRGQLAYENNKFLPHENDPLYSSSFTTEHNYLNVTYSTLLPDRSATSGGGNGMALQDLVEKVVILRKAVERERRQHTTPTSQALGSRMMEYSSLLASQGSLEIALRYLQESGEAQVSVM